MKKRIISTLAMTVLALGLFAGTALAAPDVPVTDADKIQSGTQEPVGGWNDATPYATPATTEDLNTTIQANDAGYDNGQLNANATGSNVGGTLDARLDVIKSDGMVTDDGTRNATQRTHGEYQNNTNSCASCHQTHTAAAGNLLFKDGVYSTCTACHDGTLGFYNVFANGTEASTAGTFGGTHTGNASVHLATGAVQTSAAPGGDRDGTGVWAGEFNCASCHSAHGSYSDRLLNYNPNGMGAEAPSNGGIKADDVPVVAFADRNALIASQPKYIAVKGTETEHALTAGTVPAGAVVVMIYEVKYTTNATTGVVTAAATKATNPWLYGYPTRGKTGNNHYYYARLFTTDPSAPGFLNADGTYPEANAGSVIDYYDQDKLAADGVTKVLSFDFGKGLVWSTDGSLDTATVAEISRAYVVNFDLVQTGNYGGVPITTVNESAFFAGTTSPTGEFAGVKKPGLGIALSAYCASCHTDYMAKSGTATGTFETAYRHTTTSDSYTCVRCHFAHGTDVDIMKDAEGRTVDDLQKPVIDGGKAWTLEQSEAYILDKNPSSALKRYTNMAVCWGCHTSSHAEQLKNNDYFMNSGAEVPHGLTDGDVTPDPVDVEFPTVDESGNPL